MRRSGFLATLTLLLLLPSCKDASGPAPRPDPEPELPLLAASGPDTLVGTWDGGLLSCTYSVRIRAEGTPGASASWREATARLVTTGPDFQTHFDTISAPEVWGLFGAEGIRAGETQTGILSSGFHVPSASVTSAGRGVHKATWTFKYGAGRETGAVVYEAHCGLPAPIPLLAGRYFLAAINDVPLPAAGVAADTLTFYPDTTYSIQAAIIDRGVVRAATSPRQRYTLVSQETVDLFNLLPGTGGGRFHRSGTTLQHRNGAPELGSDMVWRFDLVGTRPNLPPPPRIVVSHDTVRFSAARGGPLPDSQVVRITSSTSRQINRITGGSCLGTLAANGVCSSRWGVTSSTTSREAWTPTSISLRVLTTDLPPGTYRGVADVHTPLAVNSPYSIPVVYTVTAP